MYNERNTPANEILQLTLTENRFIRRVGNTIETCTRDYQKEKQKIKLVSAVHVGEKFYYDTLLDDLSTCDKVFYESIQFSDIPFLYRYFSFVNHFTNLIPQIYQLTSDVLDINRQTDCIKPQENWIISDVYEDEFLRDAGLLSRANLSAAFMLSVSYLHKYVLKKRSSERNLLDREEFRDKLYEGLFRGLMKSSETPIHKATSKRREARVKDKLRSYSYLRDYSSMGVLFGVSHMPPIEDFIVDELHYEETGEKWIPALSKGIRLPKSRKALSPSIRIFR